MSKEVAAAIEDALTSDRGIGDVTNVVTAIESLAQSSRVVAEAITASASPGTDAIGGSVGSLTEAAMGITAGLVQIAEAIRELAEAVRDKE